MAEQTQDKAMQSERAMRAYGLAVYKTCEAHDAYEQARARWLACEQAERVAFESFCATANATVTKK